LNLRPLLYHTHHSLFAQDLTFWSALVEKFGDPVLELGCGTGRILLHLAKKGIQTFGLDNDIDMLKFCSTLVKADFSPTPGIFLADMTSFHLNYRFPLIIMPCNTLSSLTRFERQNVLKLVQVHLAPQGIFAAAIPNPEALAELEDYGEEEVEEVFMHPLTGSPVQVSSQWRKDMGSFYLQWNYQVLESDISCQSINITTSHSLDPLSTYLSDFSNANLTVVELYGGSDFSSYNDESDELFIMAQNGSLTVEIIE
jgi:SAM-dependent methyltransferase